MQHELQCPNISVFFCLPFIPFSPQITDLYLLEDSCCCGENLLKRTTHCVLKPPRTSRYCLGQSRPLSTHGLSINPARPRSRWSGRPRKTGFYDSAGSSAAIQLGTNLIFTSLNCSAEVAQRGKRQVTRSTPRMLKILENKHF